MPVQENETVITLDGAYPNDENEELAAKKNITIIPTNISGKASDAINADFEIEEDKGIIRCPAGQCPLKTSYSEKTEAYSATFEKTTCESCPYFDKCHPNIHGRKSTKRLSKKTIRRAKYVKSRCTDEFKKYSRIRNGVETLPSLIRNLFRVDKQPWRGFLKTKLQFGCCVAAANFRKIYRQGVRVSCALFN